MLAEELECPTHTSRQMVDCLRDKNATEFVGFIKNKQVILIVFFLQVLKMIR